jgi:hypothetical protein
MRSRHNLELARRVPILSNRDPGPGRKCKSANADLFESVFEEYVKTSTFATFSNSLKNSDSIKE